MISIPRQWFCVSALLLLTVAGPGTSQEHRDASTQVLPAHAHNDYHHPRPLFDALDHRFRSVEVDIFLVEQTLLVGHDGSELRQGRTLQTLYLDPLRKRIADNNGSVYGGDTPLLLLIDIKTDGEATYNVLREVLARYADILTRFEEGRVEEGAVTAVISGNRAWKAIMGDNPRYAGIDGRMADLKKGLEPDVMPLVSDHWRTHFRWDGTGAMPADERTRLRELVARAHQQGFLVRFWATPEVPALWQELRSAGVDLINTDQLSRLRDHLVSSPPQ